MMRKLLLTVVALSVFATATGSTAQAYLQQVKDKPHMSKLENRLVQQKINWHHARYVCNNGANAHKRWACKARIWLRKEYRQTYRILHPQPKLSHQAGWLCIHSREGAWNANTGNGYYGGLQMTYGWMGQVTRADLLTPMQQMAAAEGGYWKSGYSDAWMRGQWPNTYPPCAHLFR